MRYFFILNPISGNTDSPQRYKDVINEACLAKKIEFEIHETHYPGEAAVLAKKASQEGWDTVVAVGGDGTINETAGSLIGSKTILGVLPRGSGNGLARELGISLRPREAIKTLLASSPSFMDVGRVGNRHFLNLAGVGLDAQVGKAFQGRKKRGIMPYVYLTLDEIRRYSPQEIEVEIEEKKFTIRPLLLVIANGKQYGSNARIAPQARIDDGTFNLTAVQNLPLPALTAQVIKLFRGTLQPTQGIEMLTAASVILRSAKPILCHLDGEPYEGGTVMHFEILPGVLKVLRPS